VEGGVGGAGHELEVAGPVVVAVAVEVVDMLGGGERSAQEDLHHQAMLAVEFPVIRGDEVRVAGTPTPRA